MCVIENRVVKASLRYDAAITAVITVATLNDDVKYNTLRISVSFNKELMIKRPLFSEVLHSCTR